MPTGERKLFFKIYYSNPQVSFLSGKRLFPPEHPRFFHQFSHVFGKGRHPDLRLEEWNIIMVLPDEHHAQEFMDYDRRKRLMPECDWDKLERYKEQMREQHIIR